MADYKDIAGRIRTTAADGIVVESQEIIDLQNNKTQQEINSDVQTELGDRYTKEETYSKEQLDDLITTPDVNYVSVVATNATTAVTDILPATGEANTIYRVGNWNGQYDTTMYALFAWNGTTYVCLAVRSFVGEVYDVSVNHPDGQGNPTPYADLTAALGTDGANIPADIRRGGMSIKFIQGTVQGSDNKYVQYRLMSDTFNTTPANWQGVEKEVVANGKNLVPNGVIYEFVNSKNTNSSEQITPTIANDDAYINYGGSVISGGYAFYTDPISLPSGHTIVAICKGHTTNVTIISRVITAGTSYAPLVRGNSELKAYIYSNTSGNAMNIALSGLNSGGLKAYIIHNDEIDSILNRVSSIEGTLPTISKCCKNFVSVAEVNSYTGGVVLVRAYATQEFLTAKGATSFYLTTGYYPNNGRFYIQLLKNRPQTTVDIDLYRTVGSTAPTGIYEWHYRDPNNQFDIHIVVDCSVISSLNYTGLKVHFADMSFIDESTNGAIQNIKTIEDINLCLSKSNIRETITPTIANENAYIHITGGVVSGGNAFYTNPILLPNGSTIVTYVSGTNNAIAVISKVIIQNSSYQQLVSSIDSSYHKYTYTNTSGVDMQIAISGLNRTREGFIAYIIHTIDSDNIQFTERFDKTIVTPLLDPIIQSMDMLGIVKDWGFIGDSLNSGEIYFKRADTTIISEDMYAWSWGQNICQLCRTIGTNFSVGGLTAKTWIQRYWNTSNTGYKTGGSGETFNANPKQVYTICLGTNELNVMVRGGMDAAARAAYIGSWSDVDVNNFINNEDTFYGNYAGIIQRIKSIQPSAKIFLINIFSMFYNNAVRSEINTAIADIQSHFNNTFLVDLEALAPTSTEITNNYRYSGHFTAQGYMWLSYVIGNIINKIIRDNIASFNSLPFIGVSGKDDGTL